jgi:hypothetical protein
MSAQPPLGGQGQAALFRGPDRGSRTAPIGAAALAHLDKHETGTVAQNQIDLTAAPAHIARDQAKPLATQQREGLTFGFGTAALSWRWHGAN